MLLPSLDLVVPVLDESDPVAASVGEILRFVAVGFGYPTTVTVVTTPGCGVAGVAARELASADPTVQLRHVERDGRGAAVRHAWMRSDADIVAYIDAALCAGLEGLPDLVAAVASHDADIAVGSRHLPESVVVRSIRREAASRAYSVLVRAALHAPVKDARCGLKAMRASVARDLLPRITDDGCFFDTELLVEADRAGYRIRELPVNWEQVPTAGVRLLSGALADVRAIRRLRHETKRGTAGRRGGIVVGVAARG